MINTVTAADLERLHKEFPTIGRLYNNPICHPEVVSHLDAKAKYLKRGEARFYWPAGACRILAFVRQSERMASDF